MTADPLSRTEHRPYPLPNRSWAMAMEWHDLLFLHWRTPVEELAPHVPAGLTVETFDGNAWLGLIPFRMTGVRLRCLPALPGSGAFPETNLRTYVSDGNRSGVYFFTLEAASRMACRAARWLFSLNYHCAEMTCEKTNKTTRYQTRRSPGEPGTFRFRGTYTPGSRAPRNVSDDRERFLVQRYCLFSADDDGNLYRGDIHHPPWQLQPASISVDELEIRGHPSPPGRPPDSVLYAPHLSVRAWFPVSVAPGREPK